MAPERLKGHIKFITGCSAQASTSAQAAHKALGVAIDLFHHLLHGFKLAQQLFPGGKDATPVDYFSYPQAIRQTYDWFTGGEKIIYEAAFQFDRVMAALDILVNKKGKWYAYEVKSSTEVKDQFIMDAALQYYVITNAGLLLADISIIHLNNQYVRQGELDLQELFTIVSIKKEVLALQTVIKKWIAENKNCSLKKKARDKHMYTHQRYPYV